MKTGHERLEVESPRLYSAASLLLGSLVHLRGLHVQGQENLPVSPAPYILAANHRSNWDVLALGQAVREVDGSPVHFIAKRQLWYPILGRTLERLGGIKYNRDLPFARQQDVVDKVSGVIQNNGILGVFPERTRRKGPKLQIEERGLSMLAVENRVAIATAGIYGTENNIGRIFINFGRTVYTGPLSKENRRKRIIEMEREYTASLQEAIDGAYLMAGIDASNIAEQGASS